MMFIRKIAMNNSAKKTTSFCARCLKPEKNITLMTVKLNRPIASIRGQGHGYTRRYAGHRNRPAE